MEGIVNYLFVYGTLLDERNEFAAYLMQNCRFYRHAKFEGKLYDRGNYPGAIFHPGCNAFVYGSIFLMNNQEALLKKLDDYEGFGNHHPEPNEFIRELLDVETAENPVKCWVYLYNLPVDGLLPISSGDYLEYIKIK